METGNERLPFSPEEEARRMSGALPQVGESSGNGSVRARSVLRGGTMPEDGAERTARGPEGSAPATGDAEIARQLARIAQMDPEMMDLGAILRSGAGPKFREYVARGLDFVDAYTLAARERLAELRDARARDAASVKAAGKEHLSATQSRGGEGDLPVPAEELELFRALLPDVPDAEFRKYWNKNRKRG